MTSIKEEKRKQEALDFNTCEKRRVVTTTTTTDIVDTLVDCGSIWRDRRNANSMHLASEGLALTALIHEGGGEEERDVALTHLFAAIFMMPDKHTIDEMNFLMRLQPSAFSSKITSGLRPVMTEASTDHDHHHPKNRSAYSSSSSSSLGGPVVLDGIVPAICKGMFLGMPFHIEEQLYINGLGKQVLRSIALTGKHIVPQLSLNDLAYIAHKCIQYGALENLMLCFEIVGSSGKMQLLRSITDFSAILRNPYFKSEFSLSPTDAHLAGLLGAMGGEGRDKAAWLNWNPLLKAACRNDYIGDRIVEFLISENVLGAGMPGDAVSNLSFKPTLQMFVQHAQPSLIGIVFKLLHERDARLTGSTATIDTDTPTTMASKLQELGPTLFYHYCGNPSFSGEDSVRALFHAKPVSLPIDHQFPFVVAVLGILSAHTVEGMVSMLSRVELGELDSDALFIACCGGDYDRGVPKITPTQIIQAFEALWRFETQILYAKNNSSSSSGTTNTTAATTATTTDPRSGRDTVTPYRSVFHYHDAGGPQSLTYRSAPIHKALAASCLPAVAILLDKNPTLANFVPPHGPNQTSALPDPLNFVLNCHQPPSVGSGGVYRKHVWSPTNLEVKFGDEITSSCNIGYLRPQLAEDAVIVLIESGADFLSTELLKYEKYDASSYFYWAGVEHTPQLWEEIEQTLTEAEKVGGLGPMIKERGQGYPVCVELIQRRWLGAVKAMIKTAAALALKPTTTDEVVRENNNSSSAPPALDENPFLARRFPVDPITVDLDRIGVQEEEEQEDEDEKEWVPWGDHREDGGDFKKNKTPSSSCFFPKLTPLEIIATSGEHFCRDLGSAGIVVSMLEAGADVKSLVRRRCNPALEYTLETSVFPQLKQEGAFADGIIEEYRQEILKNSCGGHTVDGGCYYLTRLAEERDAKEKLLSRQQELKQHKPKKAKKKGGLGGGSVRIE